MAAPPVSTHTFAHTTVVRLRGYIGQEHTGQLRHVLVSAIMGHPKRRLIVDLSRAYALDELALGALIGAIDAADDMHVRLALRGAGAQVTAQLTNAGLSRWPRRSPTRVAARTPPHDSNLG